MARKQKNFNLKAALITFGVIGGLVLAIFGLGAIPGACVAGVLGGALGGVIPPCGNCQPSRRTRRAQNTCPSCRISTMPTFGR